MNLLFVLEKSFVVIYHLYIPKRLIYVCQIVCMKINNYILVLKEIDRRPFRYLESHRDRFQKILDIQ